jgi:cell fate (sporulation/competence/biofilm development) regulator YmcA (YheA/YmcA/DUF963 family)
MTEITENIKTWVNAEVGRMNQIASYTGISPLEFIEIVKAELKSQVKTEQKIEEKVEEIKEVEKTAVSTKAEE